MANTASALSNYTVSRDDIIARALRICGAVGQGETPTANAVTEGAAALNALVKEYQTDGMPLWKITQLTGITYTATNSYTIGISQTVNQTAPLKVLQAFNRDTSVTPNTDQPVLIVPYQDYLYLGSKTSTGHPSQLFYKTPGEGGTIPASDMIGTILVYPSPDAYSIANLSLILIAQTPFFNFDASTDIPDFPSYWFNALIWGLAGDLAYEYGVGLAERSMIAKKAAEKKEAALGFGVEEGSLFLQPRAQFNMPGGSQY
jgi:hypothetical protein